MRILILSDRIPPENRGGAGGVAWSLACALHKAGHRVRVVATTDQPAFDEERDGILTTHLHTRYPPRLRAWLSLYNPQTMPALRKIYQEWQPDLVNAHNIHEFLSYHSLTQAHQLGIPTVFSSHDPMPFAYDKLYPFANPGRCDLTAEHYRLPRFHNLRNARLRYNPTRNWIIHRILRQHTRARTAVSHALATAHHANGLPPFTVVHNGIDPATFAAQPHTIAALRDKLGLTGQKVILIAGRLRPAKGTTQLLEALLTTTGLVEQVCLLVLSSVPVAEQISAGRYTQLRDHHIISGGWLSGEELAAAYHLADVVVSPSINVDPFPTVNLEAMAARKPVITTCFGGSREAVVDGETGFVINPHDTHHFASQLTRLLQDDTQRQRMGAAGYERLIKQFTLEHYRDRMVRVYEEAIAQAATTSR